MLADRRTKIVATIGPATEEHQNLKKAIESGMNVARLNFSHGQHENHLRVLQSIRQLSRELKAPVAILQDLQGPKIRVGKMPEGGFQLVPGERVTFSPDIKVAHQTTLPTDFEELHQVSRQGTKILLDDGLMEVRVLGVRGREVDAEVVYGGILKDRKGMNLPGESLPVDCLTNKDLDDLEFGLTHGVDYVALSFVRSGSDIRKLRELIEHRRPGTKIIAKIEMLEAMEHLEEIIELSDAIMVARGDLAVEVGQSQLPGMQKRIIRWSNQAGKPVITATQMLESMKESPRPTRAEITDVANAVLDGSDALMLSAETASGKYPFQCLQTMHEIITEVERTSEYYKISLRDQFTDVAEAIAASAALSAMNLDASAIVSLTTTGRTATMISSLRPRARIIAMTDIMETLNRLELAWGIQTFTIKPYRTVDEAIQQIQDILLRFGLVQKGDKIVLTLGMPVLENAKTNSLRVYTIGSDVSRLANEELPLRCRR